MFHVCSGWGHTLYLVREYTLILIIIGVMWDGDARWYNVASVCDLVGSR